MSNLVEEFWNYLPEEVLANVFSFLPLEDRHAVLFVCKKWASTVSSATVWNFTEISCDSEYQSCILAINHLAHIRHLKIILDQTMVEDRMLVTQILDNLPKQSSKLQALIIECCGRNYSLYPGLDILQSLCQLFQSRHMIRLQYVDFRKMPFILDNSTVRLVAFRSPNLQTLLLNNRAPGSIILKPKTIVKVLQVCPQLSVLGVYYACLSKKFFLELLKPSRRPFRRLDIFYKGLKKQLSEKLWAMVSKRHPQFQVCLEFAATVTSIQLSWVLKASMPVTSVHFISSGHLVEQLGLVSRTYSQSLEKLILFTPSSEVLNSSLMDPARRCSRLQEVHCYCRVSQAVRDAFLQHCPMLTSYTFSPGPESFPSILQIILQTVYP